MGTHPIFESDFDCLTESKMSNPPTSDFTKKLNINAASFVPGQNFNAPAFVPGGGFGAPAAKQAAPPAAAPKVEEAPPAEPVKVEESEEDWDDEPEEAKPKEEEQKEEVKEEPKPEPKDQEPEPVPESNPKTESEEPEPEEEVVEEEVQLDFVNIVFIGHVDAGKSTMSGQILKLTGMVDQRTLEKYERESKEKNRESWALSWCIDTNDEERDKGKTVEYGKAFFETEKKHFTILDAPGHKSFVPSMIEGASQADFAILIISARKGEFETGFEKGGQTREHAMLVKTQGIKRLVVAINKMDDPTVEWNQTRYDEIVGKLSPWLFKQVGYKKDQVHFLPLSGFSGCNVKTGDVKKHPWYTGPSLIDYLDELPTVDRNTGGPVRFCIAQKYKDMGHIVMGKLETGRLAKGKKLSVMPNGSKVKVASIEFEENPIKVGVAGMNLKIKLEGVDNDEQLQKGFVLCDIGKECQRALVFDARMAIQEYRSIISEGFSAIIHLHTAVEEVKIQRLLGKFNRKTKKMEKFTGAKFLKQGDQGICRFKLNNMVAMDKAEDFPAMGRFTIRDEGKTIAMGLIKKIIE